MEAKAVMVADVLAAMQSEEAAKLCAEAEVSRLQERAAAAEVRTGTTACPCCACFRLEGLGLRPRIHLQTRQKRVAGCINPDYREYRCMIVYACISMLQSLRCYQCILGASEECSILYGVVSSCDAKPFIIHI